MIVGYRSELEKIVSAVAMGTYAYSLPKFSWMYWVSIEMPILLLLNMNNTFCIGCFIKCTLYITHADSKTDIRCSFHHSQCTHKNCIFQVTWLCFVYVYLPLSTLYYSSGLFYIHYRLSFSFMMCATSKANLGWIFNSINRYKLLFQY